MMPRRHRPMAAPLDDFIPTPDIRERFEVNVDAPADVVMAAARGFDMQSIPLVKAIFKARSFLTGGSRAARPPQGLMVEMKAIGWGMLRDEPGLLAEGAICQPWLADVRFRPIPAADFRTHTEPMHVKIAWTIEVTSSGPGRSRLASETRAVATDAVARRRFLRYWRWARFGIVAIRWLLLPAVARQAAAQWRNEEHATP